MYAVTARAHFGERRGDLVGMVPPGVPCPRGVVGTTDGLEVPGAIGLTVALAAPLAQRGLGGKPATPRWFRAPIRAVSSAPTLGPPGGRAWRRGHAAESGPLRSAVRAGRDAPGIRNPGVAYKEEEGVAMVGIPESAANVADEQAGDAARPGLHLADPLAAVDLAAELLHLRGEPTWQRTGRHARTLVKDADLRVVLIALRAGGRMEEHHAPGRITIQTLAGRLTLRAMGRTVALPTGHILTLGPAIPHDVEALDDSAFLLTIAWPS